MPRVFSRGLSNKIAQGESPLHLIIDKAPPCPGRGVVGLCIDRCIIDLRSLLSLRLRTDFHSAGHSDAVAIGSLTSTPESTNGIVTACLGDPISITCTHNITIGGITEWRLPGVSAQCLVVHGSPTLPICAPFTVTMVSGGSTLSSTVEITATEGLSGEVECLSGQNAALVSVLASINISVAG